MQILQEKSKRKALVLTILVYLILFVLFFVLGLKEPVPLPEDSGASVEFGWDQSAGGDAMLQQSNNTPPTPPSNPKPAPAEPTHDEPPATQEQPSIAVPNTKETKKPEKKPEKNRLKHPTKSSLKRKSL